MSKTITLADEVYKKLASYGNRDESHNTIVLRLINNQNEEETKMDRENRETVFERKDKNESESAGNPAVEKLEDGTTARWKLTQGDYAGKEKTGTVKGARIEYRGNTWSPSGFAREADQDIRGDDARNSESYGGPSEVEYKDESGEWVSINTVLES
jgi:predicted CopG family antitoxin